MYNDPFVPLMNTHTYTLACKMKIGFSPLSEREFNYTNKTGFLVHFFNGNTYKSLFI